MGKTYSCIQIVTIKEILEEGKSFNIPLSLEVLKSAERQPVEHQQLNIPLTIDVDMEIA